jgi:hypothetical protein
MIKYINVPSLLLVTKQETIKPSQLPLQKNLKEKE